MRDYGTPIDMWSMGCIFAELLNMMKENVSDYRMRHALFPGKSCYPFSPDKKPDQGYVKGFPKSMGDQLQVIFNVLGLPNDSDKSFVLTNKALNYLDTFKLTQEKKDFAHMFAVAPPEAIDLLAKMLAFNPYFRMSVDEALSHPFFADVRNQE